MESEEVSGNQTTINCSAEEWLNKAINDGHINYYEYKNFSDFKKIGKGGFGEVIKCEWKSCELTVALKRLTTLSEKIIEDFIKELKLLRKVDCHPNIIRFYGVTKDNGIYFMVLEYANEGNLREYLIAKFTSLNWTDKLRIAKEIIRGLLFLHENNIIHRDLHSKNILIHQGQPKITDFGLSKHINASSNTSKSAIHGVPGYIDPQCFFNLEYKRNKKSDIYSFGVILWEISSGQCPTHYDEIKISVKGTSPEYVKLYKDCIDIDPASRPEAKSIFNILDQLFKGTIQSNDSIDNINTAETSSSSQLINGSTQSNDSAEKYITANETSSSSQQNHIKALSVSKVVAFDIPSSSQQNYTKTRSNSNEISELPSLGNFSKIELIQNNCSVGNKKELRSLTDNGVRRKESQLINGSTQSNDTVENITTDETLSSSQLINGSTQRNDSVEISYSSQQNHIKARSVYVRRKKRNKEIESLTTEKKHANLEIESNEEDIIDQPNTSAFKNRWEAHLKEGRYEDAIAELISTKFLITYKL
ncbi:kinase-like protein [Gigaspora margarita]|uniref:Kinase-like protein n=1 Tax=Gigaspora margarita TaxID=4874 RepID=A0A8H3X1X9_GIGMA|nr:kinase-like protein [Gigaspora margarita]